MSRVNRPRGSVTVYWRLRSGGRTTREDFAHAPIRGFRSETGKRDVVSRPRVSGEQPQRITIIMELDPRECALETQPFRVIELHCGGKIDSGEASAKLCRTGRIGAALLAVYGSSHGEFEHRW